MYINQFYELSMVLDREKFQKVFRSSCNKADYVMEKEEYIDSSLEEKGLTVLYRDSQYKKKIRLIVNAGKILDGGSSNPDRMVQKINKRIGEYFGFKYKIGDFSLTGMRLVADINIGSRENVHAYLKVFRRIGKVKGFSPVDYKCFENVACFSLDGNSNGIEFMIYDLEGSYIQINGDNIKRKKLKVMINESEGILRAEVRLTKPKAIRDYTDAVEVSRQIAALSEKRQDIFLETFERIIPYGDFYKKGKAEEIIWAEIKDDRLRRRMLRLLALIPEKKSLYLAQKALDYRNMEKVMEEFAKINLSPVTISKRQDIRYLKNIYEHMFG